MENWRKFLIKENYSVEKEEEDGYVIVTYRLPQGYIKIIENSKYAGEAHSIYGFYVDEEHRGKGIDKQLVKIVIDAYPDEEISAQVSSHASLKVFLELGFRVTQKPDADYEKAKKLFDENYGSLNVRLNDPDMEDDLNEEWSKSERDKRKSKCSNPKGFTMKQFCKNQKTRSKKGEKKNEGRGDPKELRKDISDYLNTGPQKDGSPYKNVKKHLKGKKKKSDISAPPGAPGGGSIGHGALEESD